LEVGWVRRNGVVLSDQAVMEDRSLRHGDLITHVYLITDPYYLSEPLIKTNGFRMTNQTALQPYPCESVEEVDRVRGVVPHNLPNKNPYLHEFAERFKLPYQATRGGAETALPEFARKIAPARAAHRSAAERSRTDSLAG
jgi:hypothetical protein